METQESAIWTRWQKQKVLAESKGILLGIRLEDDAKTLACKQMDIQTEHNLIKDKPSYKIS